MQVWFHTKQSFYSLCADALMANVQTFHLNIVQGQESKGKSTKVKLYHPRGNLVNCYLDDYRDEKGGTISSGVCCMQQSAHSIPV